MPSTPGNKVLSKMLDRLLAGLMSGPNMNCRPHNSRQRLDLTQLAKLADISVEETLRNLLGPEKCAKTTARVKLPRKSNGDDETKSPAEKAWIDQSNLLNKLRLIADDARTYENDTGVHALSIGFPILSLPPGSFAGGARSSTKRILAPIAFIPVTLLLKRGATPVVELSCRGEGADRVSPNTALLSWIEQQTGKPQNTDAFEDEEGVDPWREIWELVKHVADAMQLTPPELLNPTSRSGRPEGAPLGEEPAEKELPTEQPAAEPLGSLHSLRECPRSDDESEQPAILLSAVLGLFPTSHQGLLRDTRAMLADENPQSGPIQNFLTSGIDFDAPIAPATPAPSKVSSRTITTERLAAAADPCQARAVALARQATGLVVHGPPGTGKSQTITNIIADHLARGQRVLLVCEKRTALDVVADRLEHMGLRSLCGIVHDPQRDQRDLYRSIHQQLDELTEAKLYPRAAAALEKTDAELQQLHDELTKFHNALMKPTVDGEASFHELMGRWMAEHQGDEARLEPRETTALNLPEVDRQRPALTELFGRAGNVQLFRNPWAKCAGISLADFLSMPMASVRNQMDRCIAAAEKADAMADPRIQSFGTAIPLAEQSRARTELVEQLVDLLPRVIDAGLLKWAGASAADYKRVPPPEMLTSYLQLMKDVPFDAGLATKAQLPSLGPLHEDWTKVAAYNNVAGSLKGLFSFQIKSDATPIFNRYGLALNKENGKRLFEMMTALTPRIMLEALRSNDLNSPGQFVIPSLPSDQVLEDWVGTFNQWIGLLMRLNKQPALEGIYDALAKAVASPESMEAFLEGLRLSPARAVALTQLEESMSESRLFDPQWQNLFDAKLMAGTLAKEALVSLSSQSDTLEGVLRARAIRQKLPASLLPAVDSLLAQSISAEAAMATLARVSLSNAIATRLRANAVLHEFDSHRVEVAFDRYRKLDAEKKNLVRDCIAHLWVSKQKDRLLANTGSRLNSAGADLRRRLTNRGERAMRLRQVIAIGDSIEGGDPLFDLCPVWMASPETVAQVFPRKAVFDVIVFDEASQCRLEEALPVLTRGRRVVIAGDPNQLPPTRFFESGVIQSQQEDPETDQELFETQQGEVEDLLAAALNLAIQQCYLDVHYRSRNSDLIEFSNRNFYASRLQAIPGHPQNRSRFSPLTLYRVDGTYSKRQNEIEADRVVRIVHDLLKRAEPPSIGVACLNLPQRDLIVEKLDDMAGEDADFARRLAAARIRKGQGSFEGLFVKNLENVQGDERDHIIISTTYGPDAEGKFYRRFGPLGMAGGGRRLNVLVTRARCEVHLVTSIPVEAYRHLPPIPEGQAATGAWLLFAYLKYAEELALLYGANVQRSTLNAQLSSEEEEAVPAVVNVLPSKSPSIFAERLGDSMAGGMKIGSDVHWGNEGFCVDLALHHPARPGDVTIGVLCDGCRYTAADDAVEWDIFRTGILAAQGWTLQRIWTPHYFRDPQGNLKTIRKSADEFVAREKPVDALAVQRDA